MGDSCDRGVVVEMDYSDGGCSSQYSDVDESDTRSVLAVPAAARHRIFSSHLLAKFEDHYRAERQIGEGSYGNVYEAVALPSDRSGGRENTSVTTSTTAEEPSPRMVAAKCFVLDLAEHGCTMPGAATSAREAAGRRASFDKERAALSKLEHPHIVKMFECFEGRGRLWIVMELCRGGELYESIAERVRAGNNGGLEEAQGRTYFRQILHAISYLHANRVVHRDVKTENFLLLGEAGSRDADVVKLCDFGTATVLTDETPRAMERIGTLSYTAPEVYCRRGATVLADVWSMGVVLYVLLVGASPFRITGEELREDTVKRIAAGDFDKERSAWHNLSASAKDLIHRFLVVNEFHRIRCYDALRHEWLEPGGGAGGAPMRALPPAYAASGAKTPRRFLTPRAVKESKLTDFAAHASALLRLINHFMHLDGMQQLALTVCTQAMPEAQLINCKEPIPFYDLFFALDSDEDGRLSTQEFVDGIRFLLHVAGNHAWSDSALRGMARGLDLDGTGEIEWVEWMSLAPLSMQSLPSDTEPMSTAFRLLDRPSGDGLIGAADLLAVIGTGAAREDAHRMLVRWAKSGAGAESAPAPVGAKKPRRRSAPSAPSLDFEDFQRLVESAISGVAGEGSMGGLGAFLLGGRGGHRRPLLKAWPGINSIGLLACCQADSGCQACQEPLADEAAQSVTPQMPMGMVTPRRASAAPPQRVVPSPPPVESVLVQ